MTDTRLARSAAAPPARGSRPFGSLPAATTTITLERALELAGVPETELALLASTTFKEARSLEELVSLVATTRRRGLDGLQKQIYYERFGGSSNDPSLHVGIDGLRAIAASTGRYGGRSEPRYSGAWDMPLENAKTKVVPEKCTVTVYAIVQNRSCAFEGVAWMEESYPGAGPRGRMWQQRPRGMLSIAAERQALRSAFPSETSGLRDLDDGEAEDEPVPSPRGPSRSPAENAALYDRIQDLETGERLPPPSPPSPRDRVADLRQAYDELRSEAIERGTIAEASTDWMLPQDSSERAIVARGKALRTLVEAGGWVDVRAEMANHLAALIEEASALDVEYADCRLEYPCIYEAVLQATNRLDERITAAHRAQEAEPSLPL